MVIAEGIASPPALPQTARNAIAAVQPPSIPFAASYPGSAIARQSPSSIACSANARSSSPTAISGPYRRVDDSPQS